MLNVGLITRDINLFIDTLFCIPNYHFFSLRSGLADYQFPNPYGLMPIDEPDVIFIDSSSFFDVTQRLPGQWGAICDRLRSVSRTGLLVGCEGKDWFHLAQPPEAYEPMDIILKNGGVFRDRELYNFKTGACSTNRNWTDKSVPLEHPYSLDTLDKLRLSFSCFITVNRHIRRRARQILPTISAKSRYLRYWGDLWSVLEMNVLRTWKRRPSRFIHCFGKLSHIQRLEVLLQLEEYGYSGLQQLTPFTHAYVWGTEYDRQPLPESKWIEIRELCEQHGFVGKRLNRNAFKRSLLDHQVILSPTGFGELCFRHAEAWMAQRLLVCQDLSHVELLYPLTHMENVVFCKSDFSDLHDILNAIQQGEIPADQIAQTGYQVWKDWSADYQQVLHQGVVRHVDRELGMLTAV